MSESSFTCPELRTSGVVWTLSLVLEWNNTHISQVLFRLNHFKFLDADLNMVQSPNLIKWYLLLAPFHWYVTPWEIWGNHISCHVRVTLCTSQWKCWLQKYENVTKLRYMLRAIWLAETCIYNIIIYSWYEVTQTWPVMEFPQISHAVTFQ